MRRAALVLAAIGGLALPVQAAAPAKPRDPARLQVVAREFSLVLSRQSVPAGPIVIELVNLGEDPHDLKLRRIGGTRTYTIPVVGPGERGELETRLRAGRFKVWCAVDHHRDRGMRASLKVVAPITRATR